MEAVEAAMNNNAVGVALKGVAMCIVVIVQKPLGEVPA
jgi:hypothetical protein